MYADAHGLEIEADLPGDGWYDAPNRMLRAYTLPIRLSIKQSDFCLWPIERQALRLLKASPRLRANWPEPYAAP